MQQIPNYLNARQKLFCHWFALTRDAQGAADRCFRAPEKREEALLLLQTPLAQDYLRQVEAALGGEGLTATAEEGYRRLAFGPVTDAVRLMFPTEDETPPLEEMDLYNISKISQAKGGLEITFFDRLEALDRLAAQQKEAAVQQDAFGFLDAVAAGAAAGDEEDRGCALPPSAKNSCGCSPGGAPAPRTVKKTPSSAMGRCAAVKRCVFPSPS